MKHYFKCVKGVFEPHDSKKPKDGGNILSFVNEIWEFVESDETGTTMKCVEGPNSSWEFGFTNQQMVECFVWDKAYTDFKAGGILINNK